MIVQRIIPLSSIGNLNIYDVAEENEAVIKQTRPNKRFHYVIHFVLDGEGTFYTVSANNKIEQKLTKNTLFAIYTDEIVSYKSNPKNPLHYYWVGFDGEETESILNYIGFSAQSPTLQITSGEELAEAFNTLLSSWNEHDNYALFSAFYNCIHIMRKNNIAPPKQILSKNENNIVLRAQDYIHSNLHNNIKVQDVVKHLNIDRSYFTKIFKQKLSVTPSFYITKWRLNEAEHLLNMTNFTIQEIVNILNFNDVYSFSRLFKNNTHYSPTEYRKRLRREHEKE